MWTTWNCVHVILQPVEAAELFAQPLDQFGDFHGFRSLFKRFGQHLLLLQRATVPAEWESLRVLRTAPNCQTEPTNGSCGDDRCDVLGRLSLQDTMCREVTQPRAMWGGWWFVVTLTMSPRGSRMWKTGTSTQCLEGTPPPHLQAAGSVHNTRSCGGLAPLIHTLLCAGVTEGKCSGREERNTRYLGVATLNFHKTRFSTGPCHTRLDLDLENLCRQLSLQRFGSWFSLFAWTHVSSAYREHTQGLRENPKCHVPLCLLTK